jgi:hypothetical protein
MKLALIVSLSLALATARADTNLLTNGDFSKGTDSWTGDIKVMTPGDRTFSGSIDLSKGAAGVIISLAQSQDFPSKYWFGLYQGFKSSSPALNYSITYQVSDDYGPKDSVPNPDTADVLHPKIDISQPASMLASIDSNRTHTGDLQPVSGSDFAIFVIDKTTGATVGNLVEPTTGSIATQTASGSMNNPTGSDDKLVVVIFKVGAGKVALFNISITPSDVPAAAAPLLDRSSTIPQL